MTANEKFLTQRQRYQPVTLPQDFSDEEMAKDWALSETDKKEVNRYHTNSRLFIAILLAGPLRVIVLVLGDPHAVVAAPLRLRLGHTVIQLAVCAHGVGPMVAVHIAGIGFDIGASVGGATI